MRANGIHGITKAKGPRTTILGPVGDLSNRPDDLVRRQFVADAPNRLWCTDITEHPTGEGKVYACAVLDVFSRQIVGWSIADHMRAELVVDALHGGDLAPPP